jgi:hypothetical protein
MDDTRKAFRILVKEPRDHLEESGVNCMKILNDSEKIKCRVCTALKWTRYRQAEDTFVCMEMNCWV